MCCSLCLLGCCFSNSCFPWSAELLAFACNGGCASGSDPQMLSLLESFPECSSKKNGGCCHLPMLKLQVTAETEVRLLDIQRKSGQKLRDLKPAGFLVLARSGLGGSRADPHGWGSSAILSCDVSLFCSGSFCAVSAKGSWHGARLVKFKFCKPLVLCDLIFLPLPASFPVSRSLSCSSLALPLSLFFFFSLSLSLSCFTPQAWTTCN